jgi:hypothetical protein
MTDYIDRIRRRLPAGYSQLFGSKPDAHSERTEKADDGAGRNEGAGSNSGASLWDVKGMDGLIALSDEAVQECSNGDESSRSCL